MELSSLLNSVKAVQVVGEISREPITGIFYHSRKVIKNSIFVAIKGFQTDGHKFIMDAINNGAAVIVLEDNESFPDDPLIHKKVTKILVKDSRIALAELSNSFFNEPSKKMKLIGVTGTNGKTTTTYFIKSIFENAGYKTGLIGTITNFIGNKEISSSLTTPESNDLNAFFNDMYSQGCTYGVMEVSSHSLVLKRTHKIFFSVGVFTNLTQDHLDFHQNFDNYFYAKKILFDNLDTASTAVYNLDDSFGSRIVADTKANRISYGTETSANFQLKDVSFDLNGTNFSITHNERTYKASTSLVGDFNAHNACAAFTAASSLGIDAEIIVKGIKNTKAVPGRFEVIGVGNKKVIIDYSHTPDSLKKALLAIRKIVKDDKPVYAVFGCGGNRDKTKRPIMGKIASDYADSVIVTSDNPRFEEPLSIINEIKSGIIKKNYNVIENREDAIKSAINSSEENAVILIAGKGHETYQDIKGNKIHFSDKEIAEKYLLR